MKIESTDPNSKTLWVKAASGQVEDIVDIQSNAGVSYFKIDAAGNVSISGLGDVSGPASSTDNTITRFNGTSGKTIQGSLVTIDDNGKINIPSGQTYDINGTPHTHPGGAGDVTGPGSSTDNAFARFDSTTGKIIQNSLVTSDDNGSVNIPSGQFYKVNNTALAYGDVGAAASSHNHSPSEVGLANVDNAHQVFKIASSTDNAVVRWDSTTGAYVQNSVVTIDDTGIISTDASLVTNAGTSGGGNAHHSFKNTNENRWLLGMGGTESTGNLGGDLKLWAYDDDGNYLRNNVNIDRKYGTVTVDGDVDISSGKLYKINGSAHTHSASDIGLGNVTNDAQVKKISSSTDNQVVRWDSTTGALVQGSLMTIDDSGTPNIPSGQTYNINGSAHSHAYVAQALNSTNNTVSGRTSGEVVHMTGATTFDITKLAFSEMATGRIALTQMTTGTNGYFLKGTGATDPAYSAFALADIPSGTGVLKASGGAPSYQSLSSSDVGLGNVTNDAQVRKISSSTDNAVVRWDSTTGALVQDSVVTIADTTGAISINGHQAMTDPTGSPSGKFLRDDGVWTSPSGSGDVVGPGSATDNALPRFDTTTGKLLQNSVITVADTTGALSINAHQALTDPGASPSGKYLRDDGTWQTVSGSGDVVGPAGATNNAVARFDSATGKLLKNCLATIDDSGKVNIPTGQTYDINGSPHTHSLAAHALTSATHAESGLTTGHLLKATGTTTFGFSAGAAGDVGLGNVTNNAQVKKIGSSTDNQVMRWDGTTGDTPQGSLMTIDDSGTPNIPSGQTYNINGSAHAHAYVAQALNSTNNTVSGRTSGEVVHMTGATTFDITKLQFSEMATGQATLSQMPRAASGFLKGLGAGADPGYTALALADFPSGTGFLKGAGSTPTYTSFALTDIPSGTGVLKATGSTPTYQTLTSSDVSLGNVTNNAQVRKIGTSVDNQVVRWDGTTGDTVQQCLLTVDDTGTTNIPTGQTYNINGSAHTHSLAAHALTSATHAESGLTSGHLLKATGTTTFGFSAGAAGDVGLGNVTNNAQVKKIGSSTDNQVMRWDGTTGDTPQACLLTVDDSGTCNIPTGQTYNINGSAHTHTPTQAGLGNVTNDAQVKKITSSTDNAIVRWDSTTGALVQDSVVTVADTTGTIAINGHTAITDPTVSPTGKFLRDDGSWQTVSGSGDVVGPASATDNAITRFDTTTGKLIQTSLASIDDSGSVNIPTGQTYKINGSAHTHSASDVGLGNVTNNAQIKDPGSSVDNQILRWDGTTGDTVQACLLTVDDSGTANIPTGQTYNINGSAHTHGVTTGGTGQTTCAKGDLFVGSGSNTVGKLTVGTNNYILVAASGETTGVKWASDVVAIPFIIDGGGSAITTGQKGHIEVPFACTITGWTLLADQSGSITIDTWKDTYANFPPAVADTMWGTKPALSSVQKNQATGLSIAVTAGDIIAYNVDSATTVTRVTLSFTATKSR